MNADLEATCGSLVIGGFDGEAVPPSFRHALARGRRGGAILFKRNLSGAPAQAAAVNAALAAAAAEGHGPPLLAVDQEGGRVARFGAPLLRVPPLAQLGALGDGDLAFRVAAAQGRELAALGFTMNFAPVLDVNVRADNPVIGDRSFGADPARVAALGVAWARGLEAGGVLPCGKHYPGHGDTTVDSHVGLPTVAAPRERLEAVELVPFRAAAAAKVAALMTAHVLYPALDAERPATVSPAIATALLRGGLSFEGVLVSDDLEMGALAARGAVEDLAVEAVAAGCDLLLVCSSEALQDRAVAALAREARKSAAFRHRCEDAAARGLALRQRRPPRPVLEAAALAAAVPTPEARALEAELGRRLAAPGGRP